MRVCARTCGTSPKSVHDQPPAVPSCSGRGPSLPREAPSVFRVPATARGELCPALNETADFTRCFRGSVFFQEDVIRMRRGRAKGSGPGLPCISGAQTLMWLRARPEGRQPLCWGMVTGCRAHVVRLVWLRVSGWWSQGAGVHRRDVGLRAGPQPCYSTRPRWPSSPRASGALSAEGGHHAALAGAGTGGMRQRGQVP